MDATKHFISRQLFVMNVASFQFFLFINDRQSYAMSVEIDLLKHKSSFADYNSDRPILEECKSIKRNPNLLPDCRLFIADSFHHGSLHLCFIKNKLLDALQKLYEPVAVPNEP